MKIPIDDYMIAERQKRIDEWCETNCRNCINNLDAGTNYVNCLEELEVEKDGIACIHYDVAVSRQAVKSALCKLCGDKKCCPFVKKDCDKLNVIDALPPVMPNKKK